MLKWTDRFDGPIIGRGRTLVKEGAVVGLHRSLPGWRAMVVGTELYSVSVQIEKGQAAGTGCTCPYAAHGENCKHMAAVFFILEGHFPDIIRDDDAALTARLNELSPDEVEDALQFAIECGSTRCIAILLNRRSTADQPKFSPDEFTLDDIPEDALPGTKADVQGDNDPMKLLFPEDFAD